MDDIITKKFFYCFLIFITLSLLTNCVSYKNVIQYDHKRYNKNDVSNDLSELNDQSSDLKNSYERILLPKKDDLEIVEELKMLHIRTSEQYRIKIGDVFNVYIDADPNFNTMNALVKSDGFISLKRLGEVEVEGFTLNGARKLIIKILMDYIHVDPKLSIIPVKIKESKVNILGEVVDPGIYPIDGNMRLLDVISAAGGISVLELENDKIEIADLDLAYIVRDNKMLPVDFSELIVKPNFLHNILLKDNDYIYIPSLVSKQVYILGEVRDPGKYMLSKNLSLSKVIAQAGGIKDSANQNIFIIRGNLKNPEVYKIKLNKILKQGLSDFLLYRDDIVYVPKSAITMYNDIINKILPTLNLLTSTTEVFIDVDTVRTIINNYAE